MYASLSFMLLFCHDFAPTVFYTLSLHDALPIFLAAGCRETHVVELGIVVTVVPACRRAGDVLAGAVILVTARECERSEEHTSELQSLRHLVCRLLLEKKNRVQHGRLKPVRRHGR